MHKNAKKLILAIFASTMIACSTANISSTNSNSSENVTQVAEKIGEDKLAGKYSEEKSEYQYREEDFSYPFQNVDITYKVPLFGWSINSISIDSTFEIEERTSVEDNIFSLAMYDWDGHFPAAYNKTSLLPEPLLRGMISVNNCYGDTDSVKVGYSYETVTKKKHFAGYSIDDVYTTKINDRETSFFEGTVTLTDGAEGYVCGYTFIADGHVGGFVSGTWDEADDNTKDLCKEFIDIGIRSLNVTPRDGETEKAPAEIDAKDVTTLTDEDSSSLSRSGLKFDAPSRNATVASSFTFCDYGNFSIYVNEDRFDEGVEPSAETAFEQAKGLCQTVYLGTAEGDIVLEDKEFTQTEIGSKNLDVMKFSGRMEYYRTSDSTAVSEKLYGYSFAYENEDGKSVPVVMIGFVEDINQSEETYQKVVKLTDDMFASLRPVSDD